MAKAKELTAFDEAKLAVDEAVKTLQAATHALVGELNAMEGRKATLSAEIDQISHGIEPLRRERDGQQAEVAKAYERSRQARVEADAEIAKIKADVEHWEKKKVTAKAEAEAEHTKVMLAKQNELDVLEEKIANAEKKIRDLKNKIAKDP